MTDIGYSLLSALAVGDNLPQHVRGPISRTTLALFAGASNDHVPLHIDIDYAKSAGMDDVFAHGMLSMAYLTQMLTRWAPPERLRQCSVRFTAITPLHATLYCRGEVTAIFEQDGKRHARIALGASTDRDVQTIAGDAIIVID